MTIINVDVFYQNGMSLNFCFPTSHVFQAVTGEHIAALECLDVSERESNPTESMCSFLGEQGPDDETDSSFLTAEKILTMWMRGQPVRIILSGVYFFDATQIHHTSLEGDEPSLEKAWHVAKHLELQFQTKVFIQKHESKFKSTPDWFSPVVGCEIVDNPLYAAMQYLVSK